MREEDENSQDEEEDVKNLIIKFLNLSINDKEEEKIKNNNNTIIEKENIKKNNRKRKRNPIEKIERNKRRRLK